MEINMKLIVCLDETGGMSWGKRRQSRDTEVIKIAVGLMLIYSAFMPFWPVAFNMPQGFKGARDTKFSLVIGTISMWLTRVLGSWFFGIYLGMQAYGIFLSMCLDWVIRGVCFYWWYKSGHWLRFVKD